MADQAPILSAVDAERFRAYDRQRHDSLAASYHDFFTPVTAPAISHLCDAVHLAPGTELLDVATGPGSLAATATRLGAHAGGVDLSPGMIALAKRLYPATHFRVADVEHLPLADATFDGLVCNFAIGHFPYPEAAVGECVRVLKWGDASRAPGGMIPAASASRVYFERQSPRLAPTHPPTSRRVIRSCASPTAPRLPAC